MRTFEIAFELRDWSQWISAVTHFLKHSRTLRSNETQNDPDAFWPLLKAVDAEDKTTSAYPAGGREEK